jgi:hypothetical protein
MTTIHHCAPRSSLFSLVYIFTPLTIFTSSSNSELHSGLVGLFLLPPLSHRASVKGFVSLQFFNLRHLVGLLARVISTSQGRYLTQTQNKHRHPWLEWDSNPRSQRSSERRQFIPLDRAAGRAIAQAVGRWLPTAAARVQTRVWSCGILWWTKVGLGQVFSENFGFPFPLPIYIPSISPQSSSLSPEANTIGQEWPHSHKQNK